MPDPQEAISGEKGQAISAVTPTRENESGASVSNTNPTATDTKTDGNSPAGVAMITETPTGAIDEGGQKGDVLPQRFYYGDEGSSLLSDWTDPSKHPTYGSNNDKDYFWDGHRWYYLRDGNVSPAPSSGDWRWDPTQKWYNWNDGSTLPGGDYNKDNYVYVNGKWSDLKDGNTNPGPGYFWNLKYKRWINWSDHNHNPDPEHSGNWLWINDRWYDLTDSATPPGGDKNNYAYINGKWVDLRVQTPLFPSSDYVWRPDYGRYINLHDASRYPEPDHKENWVYVGGTWFDVTKKYPEIPGYTWDSTLNRYIENS